MKILKTTLLISMTIATNTSYAEQVTWLDGGHKVHANIEESNITTAKSNDQESNNSKYTDTEGVVESNPLIIILSTGSQASILGGVYVKTTNVENVLLWAIENNYEANDDDDIEGAVKVQTTPDKAIEVANEIAQLEGVTTAAPTLGRKLDKK